MVVDNVIRAGVAVVGLAVGACLVIVLCAAGCASPTAPAPAAAEVENPVRVVAWNVSPKGTVRIFDSRDMIDYLPTDTHDTLTVARGELLTARWCTGNKIATLRAEKDTTWVIQ